MRALASSRALITTAIVHITITVRAKSWKLCNEVLQDAMTRVTAWCKKSGCIVNMHKTEVMCWPVRTYLDYKDKECGKWTYDKKKNQQDAECPRMTIDTGDREFNKVNCVNEVITWTPSSYVKLLGVKLDCLFTFKRHGKNT